MDLQTKQITLLKLIQEIQGYAIFLLDENGNVETWNAGAQKIKGYLADEIIGKNISIFYTQVDLAKNLPQTLLAEAAKNGTAYNESWRVRKDGSTFWGAVTIMAMYNEEGKVYGFAKITRDLTEKMLSELTIKQHAENLEIKNKEIEQFVYIASHDLQEPLHTISNFAYFLKTEYAHKLDDTAQMYLEFMLQATGRMKGLITNLLDYSRIGAEKTLSEVDCNLLIAGVVANLDSTIKENGATIRYQNLPVIEAYEIELAQLFQNLLSNAIKFRDKNFAPIVEITASKEGNDWRFNVIDNGIGINPKFAEKVFLIFQRLHGRNDYEGNGIGLAHCKKIVELHGGKISVKANPVSGCTFTFTIPLNPDKPR
ncbi:sensor histidine kinase [Mucilaginibacter celer]|uniref:histidine kinase n=1 Tax=Mucilaginibacter celer TaxID=2305508 RepID=A0A494VJF7_9SPHI|nr:ATP-binding protein [Mucilaginibacter celer]AYL95166.1 PAS domain S-box protein [Mucilaginibacter celer]